ncbi:MAG: family 20 glycosylhydrolase [Rariglobus sp.]
MSAPRLPALNFLLPPRRVRRFAGSAVSRAPVRWTVPRNPRPETGAFEVGIGADGIELRANDAAGFFYAERTLANLRGQFGRTLPRLELADWPAYPVRGFYHDVTRGKVPTLKTLLALAETCAEHRLNHLELYIEHTYAFARHPKVWAGADPLTADEIRTLDARCAELHIDLVPSFSTFGHFYTWIHHAFPHLNELTRDVSADPFTWWDRMMHYTLDCRDPRSLELVSEIIREVRPLFRSRYFNICCDETFDLGTGKNRAAAARLGKGRLYVDFLKSVMGIVRDCDATPLFWGDIIRHSPELLAELPAEAIILDWDYSANLDQTKAGQFHAAGRRYYVCGGTCAWNGWLPDHATAHANLTRYARHGLACGADGMLTTDWGDSGHINTLGPTLPLLALGAAAAWNPASPALRRSRFDATASRLILGDDTGQLIGLLAQAVSAARATWNNVARSWQPRSPTIPADWFDSATGLYNDVFKRPARTHVAALNKIITLTTRIEKILVRARPADRLVTEEIHIGLLGLRVMEELHLVYHHRAGKLKKSLVAPRAVATRLADLDRRLARVWLRRNKPSELHRVREVLQTAATDLRPRYPA